MGNRSSSKSRVKGLLIAGCMVLACLSPLLIGNHLGIANPQQAHALADHPNPPSQTWKSALTTTAIAYYYVYPGGDDDYPSTETHPWRTIQ